MFTQYEICDEVVEKAGDDIRVFFDRYFIITSKERRFLIADLRKIDDHTFTHVYNKMGVLRFSWNILVWLEYTRNQLIYPWVDNNGKIQLSKKEVNIQSFLKHLEGWINRLVLPGVHPNSSQPSVLSLGRKWWEFRRFIGEKRLMQGEWKVVFYSATNDDKDFLGEFVSWLVTIKNQRTLHIIYDKEKILESSSDKGLCISRLRKVFLHELGHARTELLWYLKKVEAAIGTTWIKSLPMHEYEAWIYALTIRSLLVCIRSRVTRIAKDGDSEWLAYV